MYDICIIGAGTSGLMASIAASSYGAKTLVLERNKKVGKKLRLTGGGRCNVTNNRPVTDLINHLPGNGKFLYSAFTQFNNEDIINFFTSHNTPLKEEDHGRMFPASNTSKTIVNTLYETALEQGVDFKLQTTVTNINFTNCQYEIQTSQQTYYAKKVIISTGGKTYTYTGSTGDGYRFAKKFGHHITKLYPTECPLKAQNDFILERKLQGLALKNATISVIKNNKVQISHTLDLLFTHFGLSGPAALRCSGLIWQLLQQQETVTVTINCYPDISTKTWQQRFTEYIKQHPKKQLLSMLTNFIPERLAQVLCERLAFAPTHKLQVFPAKKIEQIIQLLQNFTLTINGTWPLEKAFVTGGGIMLNEITPKTMESKLQPGLFFTGEVLDINGYTGGFNITAAFSTGYVAGSNAAMSLWDENNF